MTHVREFIDGGINITKQKKYQCPCCGYCTLDEQPTNTFAICPVCFWEDDGVQFYKPDYRGGANTMSLNEARENFKKYGAKSAEKVKFTRPPLEEEKC